MTKREKMSKSRGNAVSVDEVVHGVRELKDGYEFRYRSGELVDWELVGVWRDIKGYTTYTRSGRSIVFLHEKDNPVPALLVDKVQHPNEIEYWVDLLEKYETC